MEKRNFIFNIPGFYYPWLYTEEHEEKSNDRVLLLVCNVKEEKYFKRKRHIHLYCL